LTTQKLAQLATGPLAILSIDIAVVLAAMSTADALGIDLTDAILLQTVQKQGVTRLATDDSKLAQACRQLGIVPENPIDTALRQQMAAWEAVNLPTKGLPRLLYQIYRWLGQDYPHAAQEFWSRTGQGSHVP
jgi:hypothetical protein